MPLTLTAVVFAASTLLSANVASAREHVLLARTPDRLPAGLSAKIAACGGSLTAALPQIGVAIVESDADGFAACAGALAGVRSVTADLSMQLIDDPAEQAAPTVSFDDAAASPPSTGDDDFFFDLQWGHDAVDAPEAWELGFRGAGVRVAVLDSGIDAEHPDLYENLNPALSASFVPGEEWNIQPGFYFNHGTHVAGTIGAADNAFGTIGVAPEVELVAIKVLSEFTGQGSFGSVIQGIVYAADIDADIINMSLGADIAHSWGDGVAELFVATGRATTYAYQHGTTVIAAAGNDGRDLDHDADLKSFPAELPHVLSIAATAPVGWAVDPSTGLDVPAGYSNHGQSGIDFAAPGGWWAYPGEELCAVGDVHDIPCWVYDMVFSTLSEGWGWASGTSMAAPHAAGVAALIIGAHGGDLAPAAVARELRAGADDLGKPGNDDDYGAGRVNALGSLD